VLDVRALVKTFPDGRRGRVVALDGVTLEVGEGELFSVLGPSGCGKTTMLRCVAGLERPDGGEIEVGGRLLFSSHGAVDVRAVDRGLGLVFQSYAIWPHMDVFRNAAFPLEVAPRRKRLPAREIRERVESVLSAVHLDHLADRRATDLSGGQQQRLALARALVMQPPLLLLDEPLSNLDARLRDELRDELKRIQHERNLTVVYVTHDQVEALTLSTTIAVMNEGRIEQVGPPRDVYLRPSSRFVADFVGAANLVEGTVRSREPGGTFDVETPFGSLSVPSTGEFRSGAKVLVVVRPEDVSLRNGAGGLRGRVLSTGFLGDAVDHVVSVGDVELRVRSSAAAAAQPGSDVGISIEPGSCTLVPAD